MAFYAFVKITGGSPAIADGESEEVNHKGWCDIFSFSHGLAQTSHGVGSATGARSAGKVDIHDFVITKRLDNLSTNLYEMCCNGTHYTKVDVELCKATGDGGKAQVFMIYNFKDVMVSSVQTSGGMGMDVPTETVAFAAGSVVWTYKILDKKTGKETGKTAGGWDLIKNTKTAG